MAKVAVYDMSGNTCGEMELSDAIFGVEINTHVMHEVVVAHLANRRQGTQSAKTRAEVRGGGKKPYRQKGTGRARQGSIRAPQWVGGGVVFAPKPRDYSKKVNKKARRVALRSALTSKVQEEKFIVLNQLSLDQIKTKEMKKVLGEIQDGTFASKWIAENKNGRAHFNASRRLHAEHLLEKTGKELRKMYSWNEEE